MTPEAMRIAIAESEGERKISVREHRYGPPPYKIVGYRKKRLDELKHYTSDLNAILPLLPVNIVIVRYERDWNVRGNDPTYHSARNQSLALAACEFYLKWKNLWKD